MNESDQTQEGQRPPQRHPGRNPEHGSPRQTEENMDFGVIAKLIKSSPEEAREALKLVTDMMGKAQAKELMHDQRKEVKQYDISQEGLVKDLTEGVNLNLIKDETVKQNLQLLLDRVAGVEVSQMEPGNMNILLGKLQGEYQTVLATDQVGAGEIGKMMNKLMEITLSFSMGRDELGAIAFSLTGEDIKQVTSGVEGARNAMEYWVSQIEKTNYSSDHDLNSLFNRSYTTTIGWLPILARKFYTHVKVNGKVVTDREEIEKAVNQLIREYKTRIHTHNMKWAIEQHDWKIVMAMASEYSSAALFEGFRLKNVSVAFNLFQRYFDRYRFAYGEVLDDTGKPTGRDGVALWRINPEIVAKIRHDVENDLYNNREFYGISAKDEKAARDEAERAANIGLNLFSASMREGVHVARGQVIRKEMKSLPGYTRDLTKEPPFQTDPNELLAVLYNPLQFALEKWSKYTGPQKILFDKIIAYLGNGDMVAGRQEFNNLLAIVDFFSSSWRIENVYTSTEARLKHFGKADETDDQRKARLDSLSTGLLLQWQNPFRKDAVPAEETKKLNEGKKRLRLTAKYRPLELLKAYAVTIDQEGKRYSTGGVQDKFQAMLKSGQLKTRGGLPIDNYVRLEEVLARYLNPIYEQAMQAGWDTIHGIDVGNAGNDLTVNPFSAPDKQLITETVDKINKKGGFDKSQELSVEDLQSLYKKMQDFLLENETIDDLATNVKHNHLYHRALYTDDAPLGRLEERVERVEGISEEIIPISEKLFTSDGGRRDPVARMWGDTSNAATVLESGMNAMIARDPESLIKSLQEAMAAQTGYAGRPPYLKFLYGISGGWLNLAKADQVMAFFNLHKSIPVASSEFQRLFGLAAPAESSQDLRQIYEKVKLILGKPDEDAGGKELDQRIKKELGIQGYKIALTILSKIMLLAIIFILQQQLEEMSKEEE